MEQDIHMAPGVTEKCCGKKHRPCRGGTVGGGVYGLGLIGAAIYYIQHAVTFWGGVIGIAKALVWPAFLIYNLFGLLQL